MATFSSHTVAERAISMSVWARANVEKSTVIILSEIHDLF